MVLIIVCVFLTTKASIFIWENIPLFSFIQFPWRFLSLVFFGLAILSSVIIFPEFYRIFIKKELNKKFFIVLTLFVFIFSLALFVVWNPAKPILYIPARKDIEYNVYFQIFDESNLVLFEEEGIERPGLNIYAGLPEFMPKGVDYELTRKKAEDLVLSMRGDYSARGKPYYIDKLILLSGEAKALDSKILVEEYEFNLEVKNEAKVRVNTFWFPGWHASIDGKEVSIDKNNPMGLMDIDIPEGNHLLKVEFKNTHLRNIAMIISLVAFVIFLVLALVILIKKVFIKKHAD